MVPGAARKTEDLEVLQLAHLVRQDFDPVVIQPGRYPTQQPSSEPGTYSAEPTRCTPAISTRQFTGKAVVPTPRDCPSQMHIHIAPGAASCTSDRHCGVAAKTQQTPIPEQHMRIWHTPTSSYHTHTHTSYPAHTSQQSPIHTHPPSRAAESLTSGW